MDERWQRELTKLREAPSPSGDLWDRIGAGPSTSQGSAENRRVLTIVVALSLAIGAIALVWIALRPLHRDEPLPGSQGVLQVPAVGQVAPASLDDGRPVFVVHREDGTVTVIDAFSTHDPGGLGKLNDWCPQSRTFEDPFHGSKWDENGSYLLGPAPTRLVTYESTLREDGRVVVGSAIAPAPRHSVQTEHVAGPFCQDRLPRVYPILPTTVQASPSAVVADAPTGWIAVQGTLLLGSTGDAELCAPPACADNAPVAGIDVQDLWDDHPWYVIAGTFIAQVRDGALVNLTRVPAGTLRTG